MIVKQFRWLMLMPMLIVWVSTTMAVDFISIRNFSFPSTIYSSNILSDAQTVCISGLNNNQFSLVLSQKNNNTKNFYINTKGLQVKLYWDGQELLQNQQYFLTANTKNGDNWCGQLRADLQPVTLFKIFNMQVNVDYTIDNVVQSGARLHATGNSGSFSISAAQSAEALLSLPGTSFSLGSYNPKNNLDYTITNICLFSNANNGLLTFRVVADTPNQIADDNTFLLRGPNDTPLNYSLSFADYKGNRVKDLRNSNLNQVQGSSSYLCNSTEYASLSIHMPSGQHVPAGTYAGKLNLNVSTL